MACCRIVSASLSLAVPTKSCIEQVRAILFKCGAQTLPGLQIVANRCRPGLLLQRPWALQISGLDAHGSLCDSRIPSRSDSR